MKSVINEHSVFYIQKEVWEEFQEYMEGYKAVIKQREMYRMIFHHRSPQSCYRPHLVDHLQKLCIRWELSHCTLHLAVYLLDIFLDNYTICPENLQMLVHVCLILAAKVEESSTKIPKISDLLSLTNQLNNRDEYKRLEVVLLSFFNCYVMFPTTAHYTFYYLQGIISLNDIKDNNNNLQVRTLFYDLSEIVTKHLDDVVGNVHLMQCFSPSKLAAAILAISRHEHGLNDWSEQLEYISDYKPENISEEMSALMQGENFQCVRCSTIHN